MAVEILLPRLGWDMTEGIFGEWLKEDGDTIKAGDLLYTVEGDKATQEVESMDAGILHIRPDGPRTGDTIEVGTLLAYIANPGDNVTFQAEPALVESTEPSKSVDEQIIHNDEESRYGPTARNSQPETRKSSSPRARRVAAELNVDWTQLNGSGRSGRIIEKDVRLAASHPSPSRAPILASPVAARMALEAGLDLHEIPTDKPGQRIQRRDVERAMVALRYAGIDETSSASIASDQETRLPVTWIRKLIAERMSQSRQITASVTLTTEADATELVALRQQLKMAYEPRGEIVPTYNDLFMKLSAVALSEHPMLNAVWDEEEIILHQAVHIGLAMDTEEGLLVPVVRDVQSKDLRAIAAESRLLVEQVQTQSINPNQLQGGTFTITNLGPYNIDTFTPIINLPQCAILGVGRILEKPAIHNGQVVPRHIVSLSLTFDHRVIDGGPAARGLDCIREFIETPLLWLV